MGVIDLVQTMLISGVATTFATEILKSKLIPVQFQQAPRITALGVAIIATAITAWQQCGGSATVCQSIFTGPLDYVAAVLGTLLVATLTYNNIVNTTGSSSKF